MSKSIMEVTCENPFGCETGNQGEMFDIKKSEVKNLLRQSFLTCVCTEHVRCTYSALFPYMQINMLLFELRRVGWTGIAMQITEKLALQLYSIQLPEVQYRICNRVPNP
jgi:hypothetical protein